jgi:hypothetical protein
MDISSLSPFTPSTTQGLSSYPAPAVSASDADDDEDTQAPGFEDDSLSISAQGQALSGVAGPGQASAPNALDNLSAAQPADPNGQSLAGKLLGAYSGPSAS